MRLGTEPGITPVSMPECLARDASAQKELCGLVFSEGEYARSLTERGLVVRYPERHVVLVKNGPTGSAR